MLELIERVVTVPSRLSRQASVSQGMRQERDDGHERKGRMEPAEVEADPRERAGDRHIGPEVDGTATAKLPGGAERSPEK